MRCCYLLSHNSAVPRGFQTHCKCSINAYGLEKNTQILFPFWLFSYFSSVLMKSFQNKDHNYNLHSSEDEEVGIVMSPCHSFLAVPLPSGDLTGNAGDLPESHCTSEESCLQMAPEQTEQQGLEGRRFLQDEDRITLPTYFTLNSPAWH